MSVFRPALAALCFVPAMLPAQGVQATATEVFHKKFFVSWQQASMSGVPISYSQGNPTGVNSAPVRSSGSGSTFGFGGSWLLKDHWLFQFGYDRASGSFSDWRVRNRSIAFNSIDMTMGYATEGAVTFVPYLTFAPGWYTQSEFREFDESSSSAIGDWAYEAMEKYDYFIGLALGLKLGFAKYVALNGELRWYKEDTGGGSGSCGTNCYVIDVSKRAPAEKYGSRTSVGVQVYFWK